MEAELAQKNLLIGVSGAISSVGISQYLLYFKSYFKEIRVIMSDHASALMPASTVSHFCDYVYTDRNQTEDKQYNHMQIGKWADVYCILPATANTIAQIANGSACNLLTTTVLAHPHPVLVFPSMNEVMWQKKAVLRNLEQVEADGHRVVPCQTIQAYEVSSGERKTNRVMPTPDKALLEIRDIWMNRQSNLAYNES